MERYKREGHAVSLDWTGRAHMRITIGPVSVTLSCSPKDEDTFIRQVERDIRRALANEELRHA
jgi:hypothetical protein